MKAETNNMLAAIKTKVEKRLTPGASVHDASYLLLYDIREQLLKGTATPKTEAKTPEPLPVQKVEKTKKRWKIF